MFADRHSDLTVDLIELIRSELGEEALDRVVRTPRRASGRPTAASLGTPPACTDRVRRLAELRSAEGYLAEAVDEGDGHVTLVEHHCPIQGAASSCGGLCSAELNLFQQALGPEVHVAREQHLLDGGQRCAYKVTLR
jgi:predicted ArsR family transcriptional regulator